MRAKYHPTSGTYTLEDMPRALAHILIWGGTTDQVQKAEEAVRQALVVVEDTGMSDNDYLATKREVDAF